jgi:hypothetical protein
MRAVHVQIAELRVDRILHRIRNKAQFLRRLKPRRHRLPGGEVSKADRIAIGPAQQLAIGRSHHIQHRPLNGCRRNSASSAMSGVARKAARIRARLATDRCCHVGAGAA